MDSKPLHRREYEQERLDRNDLLDDPVKQFLAWYQDAYAAGHRDPSAMSLATVGPDGAPHNRMVLLKAVDERGFIFATHKDSPKGRDLFQNPRAALVFYWARSERQVRVEGAARWLSREENAAIFRSRPKGAQMAALLGNQSQPVSDRETLDAMYERVAEQYETEDIPPPEGWGGFAITPTRIEFWQGGRHRLHDRFLYTRTDDGWSIERLMP